MIVAFLTAFGGCEDRDNTLTGGTRGQGSFTFSHNGEDRQGDYILNASSRRIHLSSCLYVEKISQENKIPINDLAQALAEGYVYCSRCFANEIDIENEENRNANSKDWK